jgi:hypothetical protein
MQTQYSLRTRSLLAALTLPTTVVMLAGALPAAYSQTQAPRQPQHDAAELSRIIDRVIMGEKRYVQNLKKYSPRIETYLQYDRPDAELGDTVVKDGYFLGRVSFFGKPKEISFVRLKLADQMRADLESVATPFLSPEHFVNRLAASTMLDSRHFDLQHYTFDPVGWESVGDVWCLAIDVRPRPENMLRGAFEGRIWVENRDYSIVRLNGERVNPSGFRAYTHFDSWRQNLRPGEWMPVYIYSEDSDLHGKLTVKSNTYFWGYDLASSHRQDEWTKIVVDAPSPVRDSSDPGSALSPVLGERSFEMQAERNVLERLEEARLIAPAGPVDKVMETVVNNLVVTNHLDRLPPVHCRVMLTAPLESFSLRSTIVLSRGLIDVLPDEASLAMVLSHELAHIALGQPVNTKYGFNDRLFEPDDELLAKLDISRSPQEEKAADAKALEFLENSPYKDKLGSAGLFLRAADAAAPNMPHLFGPHLGNSLVAGSTAIRMAELMSKAPKLQPARIEQIAALPLGSRVQVDAWDGSVSFSKQKPVAILGASEKMPFLVCPMFPGMVRYEDKNSQKVAARQEQSSPNPSTVRR